MKVYIWHPIKSNIVAEMNNVIILEQIVAECVKKSIISAPYAVLFLKDVKRDRKIYKYILMYKGLTHIRKIVRTNGLSLGTKVTIKKMLNIVRRVQVTIEYEFREEETSKSKRLNLIK